MRDGFQNRFGWRVAAAALVVALAPPVMAGIPVDTQLSELDAAPELRVEGGSLKLTLEEALSLALERNLGLVVERYRLSESELAVDQSKGIFDPNLTVALSSTDDTSPSASNLDGADVQTSTRDVWNFGVSRLISTGGTGSVSFNNSRLETNSLFASLNPSFSSGLDFNFGQPLLRDQGREVTRRGIKIAQTNLGISRENFESQVVDILQNVESTYWSLAEARAQLAVSEESLALAKQLHDQNRIRVDVGTLAPLELVQSEAGIATRDEEIIRARGLVGDTEDRLRQLLNLDSPETWSWSIVPETDPEIELVEIDVEQSIQIALAERPELRSKRLDQENRGLDARYFANQQKPRLDLNVRYGANGIGGDVRGGENPFTGEIIVPAPGGYSDALDQITGFDFDGWTVSLNMGYTIFNSSAKALRALAETSHDRGEAELNELQLGVATEVRRLARAVDTAAQARASAAVSRRLAEKNLDAEQKRYDNGMSTSFQVLEIQEDLSSARSREVTSVANYHRALLLYYKSIGRLLEENGVEIVGGP
ncbi:MAG: TolC family protein [Acidobacteriota bacterium]|nr:TolC family protein [Acidobacteriota bacterium]